MLTIDRAGDLALLPLGVANLFIHLGHFAQNPLRRMTLARKRGVAGDAFTLRDQLVLNHKPGFRELALRLLALLWQDPQGKQ